MRLKNFLKIIFITCLVQIVVVNSTPEVKLLHVLFRHGDKIPHKEYANYPNDPHKDHSYYPITSGGLTNKGKMREYRIGEMLRSRYAGFFGADYLPDAIYARSTSYPRAQMSLQLVLAALFPPVGEQIWNPALPWQPVSVNSAPLNADFLLFPQGCSLFKNEYTKFLKQDEPRRLIREYNNTMTYLTEKMGKIVNTTSDVYYLYNLLKEQEAVGLALPDWTSKVYPAPMSNITILDFDLHSYTEKLKRLNGGMLLKKIINDINDHVAGCLRPLGRKAFLFSAHERNVAGFARTLGTNNPQLPEYGSTIIIETLQDKEKDDNYFVRVLLWTGVTERLITQTIPGCTEICPLQEFIRLLKYVTPDDYEYSYCKKNPNSGSKLSSKNILWLLIAGIAISLNVHK